MNQKYYRNHDPQNQRWLPRRRRKRPQHGNIQDVEGGKETSAAD